MPTDYASTRDLGDGITAIDTDYVRPELDASHLIVDRGRAAFVDTGTNRSVALLLDALRGSDVEPQDVDYVFLTHVHLDHAGGAGRLIRELPNAKAVIHPRGARHMIDPEKLTRGSIAVYGEAAFRELYGELVPIDAERVVIAENDDEFTLGDRTLRALHTEGHARHHYCLHDPASSGVFTGDSFGISYREFDTVDGEFIYPTTTPVHFDPPQAHKAIDRIQSTQPVRCFLTHYSEVRNLGRLADDMHRRIDAFVDLAERHADSDGRTARMREAMYAYLTSGILAHGVDRPETEIRDLLTMDVRLNVMGLEHWLDTR